MYVKRFFLENSLLGPRTFQPGTQKEIYVDLNLPSADSLVLSPYVVAQYYLLCLNFQLGQNMPIMP